MFNDYDDHITRHKHNIRPSYLRSRNKSKSRNRTNYFAILFYDILPESIRVFSHQKYTSTLKSIHLETPPCDINDSITSRSCRLVNSKDEPLVKTSNYLTCFKLLLKYISL